MRFAQVQSTGPDKVWVNILNVQAVALAGGDAVVWDITSPDGVRVSQPASATLSALVGIADGAIAASAYGEAQAYGYRNGALTTNDTNVSIAAGNVLVPVAGQDYIVYSAAGTGVEGKVIAAELYASGATPAAALKKVFLTCM